MLPEEAGSEQDTPPISLMSSPRATTEITMTPKSKIAAMLRQFEVDSSEDSTERMRPSLPIQIASPSKTPFDKGPFIFEDEDQQLGPFALETADGGQYESPNTDAYERVKRTLLAPRAPEHDLVCEANVPSSVVRRRAVVDDGGTSLAKEVPRERRFTKSKLHRLAPVIRSTLHEESAPTPPLTEKPDQKDGVRDESDSEDIETSLRLSTSRSVRRSTGKKALEQMHKETERMTRGMNLAPKVHVNRRITVADFFAKIGYRPDEQEENVETSKDANCVSSAPPEPEALASRVNVEPPIAVSAASATGLEEEEEDETLPNIDLSSKYVPSTTTQTITGHQATIDAVTVQSITEIYLDSDSDIEITLPTRLKSHMLLFNKSNTEQRVRDRKSTLFKSLARPNSPTKLAVKSKKSEDKHLLQLASRQAITNRHAKEQLMNAKGIVVQTADERVQEVLEIENLLDRARRQAREVKKLERLGDDDDDNGSDADDEEDEDYNGQEATEDIGMSDDVWCRQLIDQCD